MMAIFLLVAAFPTQYQRSPKVSLFEAGHPLGSAWEFFNGKKPFVDFLPAHGWLEDGGFEAVAFKIDDQYPTILTTRWALMATLSVVAVFGIGFAALQSSGWSLIAAVLFLFLSNGHPLPRAAPSLVGLAVFAHGLRKARRELIFLGSALSASSVFVALDFGSYAMAAEALVLLALFLQSPKPPPRTWVASTVTGMATGSFPFFFALGVNGAVAGFLHESLLRLPHLVDSAYGLPPVDPFGWTFQQWHSPALRHLTDPLLAGVFLALSLVQIRGNDEDGPQLFFLASWSLLAFRSVVERRHIFYLAPAIAVLVTYLARALWQELAAARWGRSQKLLAVSVAILVAGLGASQVLWARAILRGVGDAYWSFLSRQQAGLGVSEVSIRGRQGVWARGDQVDRLRGVKHYLESTLRSNETFIDFANQPGLHYFVGRLNPLPYYEVPLLEDEEGQRRAIRAAEAVKPKVVLTQWGNADESMIDGISNRERAPLFWRYLQAEYPVEVKAVGCTWRLRKE
jgi:hypothetical protein